MCVRVCVCVCVSVRGDRDTDHFLEEVPLANLRQRHADLAFGAGGRERRPPITVAQTGGGGRGVQHLVIESPR